MGIRQKKRKAMRRLAAQSRNDGYATVRDYQTIHEKASLRMRPIELGPEYSITLVKSVTCTEQSAPYIGFGGFVAAERAGELVIRLDVGPSSIERTFHIDSTWCRIGLALPRENVTQAKYEVTITWNAGTYLDVWGFALNVLTLPAKVAAQKPDLTTITSSHLCPETFYLEHEQAITLEFDEDRSPKLSLEKGQSIFLKKCCYCQRHLPLNPNLLGSVAFHKHNAKKTKHQNECRACKKWRINDEFNPIRTTDQLHESSVITRERKIFLREPMILQEIKERTGAGLKSQIWEKFDRKCFYCDRPVKLDEFQLDHTRPLAYLWPIDEHATCLCPEHNNLKKDKFPVDFYNDDQLRRLAGITGLPYEELIKKSVNEDELARILEDIVGFSREWDARTFAAIARKITEIKPDIDLFEELRAASTEAYDALIQLLQDRPESLDAQLLDIDSLMES